MISPEKQLAQEKVALAQIAEAMTALRFEKELHERLPEVVKKAEAARKLLGDAKKLGRLCDQAGIEPSAVIRRAKQEGLL